MAVWRLQVKTSRKDNIADYCIENNVAAMGWSLINIPEVDRKKINLFDDYCKHAEDEYIKKDNKKYDNVKRLFYEVKENDIIWMRRNKWEYYFARVKAESRWVFNESAVSEYDAANQLTNIEWYKASERADEESVPGAVATAFNRGSTLQRIKKDGIEAYSQMLYNKLHDKSRDAYTYPNPELSLCEKNFYSLLQPKDVEDLLALWIFVTKGYICIPSTNKIATPKYECILVDPNNTERKHIYIQVKNGKESLNADDYTVLPGDVYLLSTGGKVENADKYENIFEVNPTDIYEFATNEDYSHIIPQSVLYWVEFLTEIENEKMNHDVCKGIMFDTNRSYSDTNEYEMLSQKKIAAYGDASRYINSFNKGDYALFYSKGKGIIAIGRIKSEDIKSEGNEKYRDVDMIVPENFNGNVDELPVLSPAEIKKALGRNFYWASTIKTPFLKEEQVKILITELKKKY